jgi:hypothetical protein
MQWCIVGGTVHISICIWYKICKFFCAKIVAVMRIDAIEATADDTLTPVHPYQFCLKMVVCLSANALLQALEPSLSLDQSSLLIRGDSVLEV